MCLVIHVFSINTWLIHYMIFLKLAIIISRVYLYNNIFTPAKIKENDINFQFLFIHHKLASQLLERQGGLSPTPEIFRFELNSATKVEFCLLKWTTINGSYSFQVLSMIVRLCTAVLLCNLELCEGTKSYFCSAKNDQQLKNICSFFIKIDRSKMDRNTQMTDP